jgi:hypothetical protein
MPERTVVSTADKPDERVSRSLWCLNDVEFCATLND